MDIMYVYVCMYIHTYIHTYWHQNTEVTRGVGGGRHLSDCHFVHHKSRVEWSGTGPCPKQ